MPEGHLVHFYAERDRKALAGQRVRAGSPQGRFASDAARIDGRMLRTVQAVGKHLFYVFEEDKQVHAHLGMHGKLLQLAANAPSPRATRLRLAAGSIAVHLIAPAVCELIDGASRDAIEASLGPDPLDAQANEDDFVDGVAASAHPIGVLLLDQSVVAGIGNVLRSEILNMCGIDPRRLGSSLEREQLERVWRVTVDVMDRARSLGSIVTRGTERPRDERDGRFAYKRETCARCGTPIKASDLAGRTMYVCTTCQS